MQRLNRIACLLVLATGACADASHVSNVSGDATSVQAQITTAEQAQLIAHVEAFGSGCPAGNWESIIDRERRGFTVFFHAYTLQLEPRDLVKTLACTITVDVETPPGISYAVSRFGYDGPALLAPGMEGRIETRYTFLGDPEGPVYPHRLTGPYEEVFTFVDEVPPSTRKWSSCAATRPLTIRTQMILKNGTSPGSGEMSLSHFDGESGSFYVELDAKACPFAGSPPGAASTRGLTR